MTSARAPGLGRDAFIAVATFAVAFALAAAARYQLVEPAALAHACTDDPGSLTCRIRATVVALFRHQAPGWLAATAGLMSWLLARRAVAPDAEASRGHLPRARWQLARFAGLAAIALGAVGLVLYSFDPAAAGLVLGAIALARVAVARQGATTSR